MDDRFKSEIRTSLKDKIAHVIEIAEYAGLSLDEVQEMIDEYFEEHYPQ